MRQQMGSPVVYMCNYLSPKYCVNQCWFINNEASLEWTASTGNYVRSATSFINFHPRKYPPNHYLPLYNFPRKWRTYFRWCWPEVYLSSAGDNAVVCSPLPGGTGREKGSGATFPYRARNLIQPSRTSLVQWPETLQSRGLKVLIDFHFDYGESLRTIFTQTAVDVCVKLDNYIICILWAGVRSKGVILCWWFQLAVVKLEPWFARLEEPPHLVGFTTRTLHDVNVAWWRHQI